MTAKEIETLLDKQAITEVLYRYARGWDRFDEEAVRSCFHHDSVHAHGRFKGASQDFVTRGMKAMEAVKSMSHLITNPMIEMDGDRAIAECSFLAHHRRDAADGSGEEDMFLKGRYLDIFEKRGGEWKIASRTGLHDFERVVPPADQIMASAEPEHLGQKKPDDPLYAMLASFRSGEGVAAP